jgi:methylated-DNA-protein-cysteine methyltransferase-like protein
MDDSFETAVVVVTQNIPDGEISTYGEVAEEAGYPGAARAVGNIMRTVPGLPWWRVITASGRLVPGLETEQTQRLRAEGVLVRNGRVSMKGIR